MKLDILFTIHFFAHPKKRTKEMVLFQGLFALRAKP